MNKVKQLSIEDRVKLMQKRKTDSQTSKQATINIIKHLNESTGRKFRDNTPATIKCVQKILNYGYSEIDIKKVIDSKIKDWSDDRMKQYVRPSTLFRFSNFERYIERIEMDEEIT